MINYINSLFGSSILFFISFFVFSSYTYLILNYKKILKKNIQSCNLIVELQRTINEKELLSLEFKHRVKNNFQILISLFRIQARASNYQNVDLFVQKCEARIKSMFLIHEMLSYKDEISKVNIQLFTKKLVNYLTKTHQSEHIECIVDVESVEFNPDLAIPLGLIMNELLTNSFKYGFINGAQGKVLISLKKIDNFKYRLLILDNGIGFDKELKNKDSKGLEIVSMLVAQINGKFEILSGGHGVKCLIEFEM